jgi:membrane-associated phospholipid phosphatase
MDEGLPAPVTRRLDPVARFGLRATLVGVAIALVAVPFGLLLEQVTTGGPLTRFDSSAAQGLNDRLHGQSNVIAALKLVSLTGTPLFLVAVVGAACAWLLRNGARKLVLFLVVTCLGGGLLDTVVKVAVGRPRPIVHNPVIHAIGKSFPSGHSMQGLVCYGALLLVFAPLLRGRRRTIAIAGLLAWVLAIGLSRLALGVHYITDVLGGFVLGAAWLSGMVAVFQIWREERGRRRTDPTAEGVEPEEAQELART